MINWQTKKLSELGAFSKGAGIPKDSVLPEGLPAVRYGELYTAFDTFIKNVRSYIDEGTAKESREIRRGDILFAGSGETIDEIGKSAVYQHSDFGYAGGDIITLSPDETNSSSFLAYALNSPTAREDLRRLGQGQSVVHVYRKDLEEMSLLLPEKQEQRRIVAVLGVWDEYLELLDRKIALKEQLKKGLMQQLLTGKKRLPGFIDEWREHTFGDAMVESRIKDIVNDPKKRLTVRLHLKGVAMRSYRGTEALDSTQYFLRKAGQFIYGKQNIFKGSIGIVPDHLDGYASSQDIPAFDIKAGFSVYYLFSLISRKNFYEWLENFTNGSGSKRLNPKELLRIKVKMPDIKEQIAIANAIYTAEKEVTTLEEKRRVVFDQKRYLLKNLISGTIRTPENLHIKGAN